MRQLLRMQYPLTDHSVSAAEIKRQALVRTQAQARIRGWGIYGARRITIDHAAQRVLVELVVEAPTRIDDPIFEVTSNVR